MECRQRSTRYSIQLRILENEQTGYFQFSLTPETLSRAIRHTQMNRVANPLGNLFVVVFSKSSEPFPLFLSKVMQPKIDTTMKTSTNNWRILIGVSWRHFVSYVIIFNAIHNLTVIKVSDGDDHEYIQSKQGVHYFFPSEPMHNIYSILNQSIGKTILHDPHQNPLLNCSPTVQYRLIVPQSDSSNSSAWILQSMMIRPPRQEAYNNAGGVGVAAATNIDVVPKVRGGDEIYVQWEADRSDGNDDDYMGVARVVDRNDGTYLLKFVRPPMLQYNYTKNRKQRQQAMIETGTNSSEQRTENTLHVPTLQQHGRLTIFYEYTCGIGSLFAPNKDQYSRAGEVFQTLTPTIISTASNSSSITTTRLVPRPFIHDFIPPNTRDASLSSVTTDELIDLSKYVKIIAFGDSLIAQLVRRFSGEGQWSDNIIWAQNVNQCLSTDSDAQSMIEKLHSRHGQQIRRNERRSKRVALLTGTASWDAMRGCVREDLTDHQNAIRSFIRNVTVSYPNIDIYWKAPSAFFLHRYTTFLDSFNETYFQTLKTKYGIKPLKPHYINYHVPQQMYRVQKEMMTNELRIPFLDLYDSYYLSAPWTLPGDSRHFDDTLTRLQLSYFWPGLLNKPIYIKG